MMAVIAMMIWLKFASQRERKGCQPHQEALTVTHSTFRSPCRVSVAFNYSGDKCQCWKWWVGGEGMTYQNDAAGCHGWWVLAVVMTADEVITTTDVASVPCGRSRNHFGEQCENGVHGPGRQRDPGPGWHPVPRRTAWGPSRPHLPHRGLCSLQPDTLMLVNAGCNRQRFVFVSEIVSLLIILLKIP